MRDRAGTLILTLLVLTPAAAFGQGQTLTAHWAPNPPTDQVTGYEVCLGTASGTCSVAQTLVPATQTWFTFTPSPGVLYYFAVKAISAKGKSNFSTVVRASIPKFVQPATKSSTVNVPIGPFNLQVSDPDGGTLQFSATGLPLGLSINSTTGQITGIPTAIGSYNVTVMVFDGLARVFTSFVWKIADGTLPTLTVTSHTSGMTLTTSVVTLSGTATDNGSGGSGIASVTVNGQPATGGAATGNGIAYWSRNLTLAVGANALTVQAIDGSGNVRTVSITLNLGSSSGSTSGGPMTGASLTANRTSPQPPGTQVTFTASGTGGVTPYQYQWHLQLNGGAWQLLRSWSTTTTYSWTPTLSGNYVIALWARSAGSTTNTWQAYAERAFVIGTTSSTTSPSPAVMTSASVTPSLVSPQPVGTTVTFTASGAGGVAPYQYQWYIRLNSGAWTLLRSWSTTTTYSWTPTQAGTYNIAIWARSYGSTTNAWQAYAERTYVIGTSTSTSTTTSTPMTGASLTTSVPSPQPLGTQVTLTASGTGGTTPYQYQWYAQVNNGPWVLLRSWSTTKTYTFTPAQTGTYLMAIWARSAGSTVNAWQAYAERVLTLY